MKIWFTGVWLSGEVVFSMCLTGWSGCNCNMLCQLFECEMDNKDVSKCQVLYLCYFSSTILKWCYAFISESSMLGATVAHILNSFN